MQQIKAIISTIIEEIFNIDEIVEFSVPDEQFGDYATNIALRLSKKVGQNPREVAQKIVDNLKHESIAKLTIAGPGFINITLADEALFEISTTEPRQMLKDKVILAEYSDPNPLKPLHAGHLYTTLVGDTIARLVERGGAKITRINYGGDVGLHVGKSIWAIIAHLGGEYPEKLNDIPVNERPAWLGARYVEGNNAYEDDEESKKQIVNRNRQIYEVHAEDDHESPLAQIYWTVRQWSYDYFDVLYQQLQVKPFDRYIPESEVTPLGIKTVSEQLEKGVFEQSDGAVIFNGDKYGLHTRVFINSEGIPTYEAKDVGLSLTKWNDYHFDKSIIITATEQQQYMQVVIKAIEQFAPEPAQRTTHLTHGVVKLSGGIKMSSRKGNIVTALEILEAAREAGQETGTNPNEETILAAVKYAFAKNKIGSDISYDPTESIALEGNSGPYLQYAHARACSVLQKSALVHKGQSLVAPLELAERSLLRKISEYNDVLEHAIDELMPHYICTYLYELAQTFNRFYEHNHVIGNEREETRIQLVSMYAKTLKDGLELLGIHAPEKM
ncbi:arginine--tRNA ligase [Candidatus Saccharibacteria bacterium]|nr:arginine--tRNA ligase [Candidatus Saccharibacteria bacterium]